MKKLILAVKRLNIRMQMRSATAELEAAVKRIEHDQELIAMLWQERADLQAKAYWLEKNNFSVRGINA